jgi:prepilin-type N-terminal cleavage/methylation domain-containing protein
MRVVTRKGFTLLEVLVALAIFGILFGGVFAAIQQTNYLSNHTANLLRARLLANEIIETLKVHPFETLHNYSFTDVSKLGDMTVDIQIAEFPPPPLKQITVVVKWQDARQIERKYSLSTLRSPYVLQTN